MATSPRSLLPHFLAALYALAIVYASLEPFAPWIAPLPGTPFFLFATWPPRWTRFDVIANVTAYIPFGFFVALMPRRRPPFGRLSVAIAAGVAMSFAMETLQMFLPPRDASLVDVIANTIGAALGGAIAVSLARSDATRRGFTDLRNRWFLPGRTGDLGLALLAIWIAVQFNPGIPLFAATFDPTPQLPPAGASGVSAGLDVAAMLVTGAHSAFQLVGVGLFLALILRERRYVGIAMLLLIASAVAVKGVGAALLLKPAAWDYWLSPGVATGVAAGALLLSAAVALPRPAQVAMCAVALLSSLLATLFVPDILFARAPVSLFSWSYGHLLNFNGLTLAVLLTWPLVASVYLLALAAQPGWGAARD